MFATKAGARAYGNAPGTFIIATSACALTFKNDLDVQETTFDDFYRFVQLAKAKADTENDLHAAYQFALINLSEFYQSDVTTETVLHYLKQAADNGHVGAACAYGQVHPNFKVGEFYLNKAHHQGHQDAMYMIGELYSTSFYQIDALEDRYSSFSALANERYKQAAEMGHLLAQEKVEHYEADNFNFDRILFGINIPNRIGYERDQPVQVSQFINAKIY